MAKRIFNVNNATLRELGRIMKSVLMFFFVSWIPWCAWAPAAAEPWSGAEEFFADVSFLSSLGDRSTGSAGLETAASYIEERFKDLGFEKVDVHKFSAPVRMDGGSWIHLPDPGTRHPIQPLRCNAISPGAAPPGGIEGPLVYVGSGEWPRFNGKTIQGAVVLMELESGRNWLNAANIGARAVIYVDRGDSPRFN
ncbi:MAG: hypothetical protein GY859_29585, partial [Desulfobacterales bacterium]|nr:hypothetical protein [Desulfobacterales bacterium]